MAKLVSFIRAVGDAISTIVGVVLDLATSIIKKINTSLPAIIIVIIAAEVVLKLKTGVLTRILDLAKSIGITGWVLSAIVIVSIGACAFKDKK